jgi:release factor glutamine methyltransferase
VGCGPGLLGIVAAKMGAREVWAIDSRPAAVDAVRQNAVRNGVEIRAKGGDGFEPVLGRRFDLILAHPPYLPAPAPAQGPLFGGSDGLRHFEFLVREAPEQLEDGGQLMTCLGSLAPVAQFEARLGERFRFRALPRTKSEIARKDLEASAAGLFPYLAERRDRGLAEFEPCDEKIGFFIHYYMAQKK